MNRQLHFTAHAVRAPFSALAVVFTLAQACGYSEAAMQVQRDRYSALRAELQRTQTQCDQRADRLREMEARNATLADDVRALGGNIHALAMYHSALRTHLEELRRAHTALEAEHAALHESLETVQRRRADAEARAQIFRSMLEHFRAMIAAGELSVRVVRNRMVIVLPEAVLFDTGRVKIKPDGQRVLERVAEVLRALPRDFQVAGHTDNIPIHTAKFVSNWELATARAVHVAQFLRDRGMPANRLSVAGYADTQPVATNETPEGRQQNRRTEIVLLPAFNELPDLSGLQNPG